MSNELVHVIECQMENVKRVALVRFSPKGKGLTVIGGDNKQGKTSILDALCFALAGEKYRPTNLQRDGSLSPAEISVKLSNGLLVERKGKNATLKVTDPTGNRAGQKLLDALLEELALNLPRFLAMTARDKANVLLQIIGIGEQLKELENEERKAYDERHVFGIMCEQKNAYATELPWHADAPETPVSAAELVQSAQAVMARNAERVNARANIDRAYALVETAKIAEAAAARRVNEIEEMLSRAKADHADRSTAVTKANESFESAQLVVDDDESTADIQAQIENIEATNAKVRDNLNKAKAKDDAEAASAKYDALGASVDAVRSRRRALLDGAAMPLPGLSIEAGELTYNGKSWDCMSGVEKVRAGVAIVRKLKPTCGFVLLDGLEAFDVAQLAELDQWLAAEGMQGIGTRVSRGDECTLIIEDGMVKSETVTTTNEEEW